jgi:hypothetical protein
MLRLGITGALLSMFFLACSGGGALGGSIRGGGGSVPFAAVQSIFASNCVACHDPGHPFLPGSQTDIEMDLTPNDAYSALVGKAANEECGGTLVRSGDPSQSYLYAKITQDKPCIGVRMPCQGMVPTPPLPADQIAVVESWILDGAMP